MGWILELLVGLWQAHIERRRFRAARKAYLRRGPIGDIHSAFVAGWGAFRPGEQNKYSLQRGFWFWEWLRKRPESWGHIPGVDPFRAAAAFSAGWKASKKSVPPRANYENPNWAFGLQPGETVISDPTRLPSDLPLDRAGAIFPARRGGRA